MQFIKKTFTLFLAALMMTAALPFTALAANGEAIYEDVPDGYWGASAINYLTRNGIMSGVTTSGSERYFEPGRDITRAEYVSVIGGASVEEMTGLWEFSDVRTSNWFYHCVSWAGMKGLVIGVGNDQFAPNNAITRQDLAVMTTKFIAYMGIEFDETETEAFADMDDCASYALEAVQFLKDTGIITGKGGNVFDPKATATRAECAAIVEKIYDKFNQSDNTESVVRRVYDYLLYGQVAKSYAESLSWTKLFLDQVDIAGMYADYCLAGGTVNDIQEFALYLTLNAPVPANWRELFESEWDSAEIDHYEQLEGVFYTVYVMVDGVETEYVTLNTRTGNYHG